MSISDMTPEEYSTFNKLRNRMIDHRQDLERGWKKEWDSRPEMGHTHFATAPPHVTTFCQLVDGEELTFFEKYLPHESNMNKVSCLACRAIVKWMIREARRRQAAGITERFSLPDHLLVKAQARGMGEPVNFHEMYELD